jgi:hypothetical protein
LVNVVAEAGADFHKVEIRSQPIGPPQKYPAASSPAAYPWGHIS